MPESPAKKNDRCHFEEVSQHSSMDFLYPCTAEPRSGCAFACEVDGSGLNNSEALS